MPEFCLITGAASGIGRACAERLGRHNRLIISDISEQQLNDTSRYLTHRGIRNHALPCDVSSRKQVENLVDQAAQTGMLRRVVHAAGVSTSSVKDGAQMYAINLFGSVYLIDALTQHMKDGAAMVCIASQASWFSEPFASEETKTVLRTPLEGDLADRLRAIDPTGRALEPGAAYGLSKLGVRYAVQDAAMAWGKQDARINSISPGIIETPMSLAEAEKFPEIKTITDLTPLGRWGQASEVARAIEFMLSDGASFMTGTDLLYDGGSTRHYVDAIRKQLSAAAE